MDGWNCSEHIMLLFACVGCNCVCCGLQQVDLHYLLALRIIICNEVVQLLPRHKTTVRPHL